DRPLLGRHRRLLQTGKQSLAWLCRRPQQQNPRLPATRLRPARRRISSPQGSHMHASAAVIPQNHPLDFLKTHKNKCSSTYVIRSMVLTISLESSRKKGTPRELFARFAE